MDSGFRLLASRFQRKKHTGTALGDGTSGISYCQFQAQLSGFPNVLAPQRFRFWRNRGPPGSQSKT